MRTVGVPLTVIMEMLHQHLGRMIGNEFVPNEAGRATLKKVLGSSSRTVRVIVEGTHAQTLPAWTVPRAKSRSRSN